MTDQRSDHTWRLKLRYGRLKTPYHHYTAIAEGLVGELKDGFSCRPGPAFIAMKTWASSLDESAAMVSSISRQIGFTITGRIEIWETEPAQPPRESPYGYDINFTTFDR